MTTLICVPWYGAPELLERCVRSVLAQTDRDIAVLVVADGDDPPPLPHDSRLDVYRLPENRGPYFAQQVALLASPFQWYAPVGADDWIEPDHLERLAAVGGEAVMTGAVWFHNLKGSVSVHEGNYEVGRFATRRLLDLGGHNPAERMGQDSLMIRLLRTTGPLRYTTHPTYHRMKRRGSLMTAPDTAPGSVARNEMRRRNRIVAAECKRLGTVDAIRLYRMDLVPSRIADEVAEHAARISERLGQEIAA